MTEAQLRALIAEFTTQTEDFVQAIFIRAFGFNEGKVELLEGTHIIEFEIPYSINEAWTFGKLRAIDTDGFDIGVEITDENQGGFTVTVAGDCTFEWNTTYLRKWISD
jgi:hypothetical protein